MNGDPDRPGPDDTETDIEAETEIDDEDTDQPYGVLPVFDMESFRVRVCADRCKTCIFRDGNLMHLDPGRVKDMVDGSHDREGHIVCHSTLPGNDTGTVAAVCKGYADNPKSVNSAALRFARHLRRATLVDTATGEGTHTDDYRDRYSDHPLSRTLDGIL